VSAGQIDLLDPHALAEQAGRQVTVADIARAAAATSRSDNTDRAFAADWRTWLAFCEMAQRGGTDATPLPLARDQSDQLTAFAVWLAGGGLMPDGRHRAPSAPETIRRRLTGVLNGWAHRDHEYPRKVTKAARDWASWYEAQLIERNMPTGRGPAEPLRISDLYKIAATVPPTLAGARDLALVLFDFALGARRSELAFLDVPDITATDDGLEVHIRKSKTGHRRPAIPYADDPVICAVLAWRRWRERSAIVTGAAFRTVDRHDNLGPRMSGEAVSDVLTRCGQRAGLDHRLTGHSGRRGLATEARRKGARIEKIADQAGWKRTSPVLHGYIEDVDKWSDNVLRGLL
jgi:integrase